MIKNTTKNFVIIKKAKICRSIICKACGFMFRLQTPDYAQVFIFNNERKIDLHMFFVFFPIDVLFLDKDKKVVEIKKNFEPFAYYSPKVKAQYIVELPVGMLKKTKVGDNIGFG